MNKSNILLTNLRNGLIEKQKRLNLLLGVVFDHDDETKNAELDPPEVIISSKNIKTETEIKFIEEEEDETQQTEEESDFQEEQYEPEEETNEVEEVTEIVNEVQYEMLDEDEEYEEDEDADQETYQAADCEEYEYVEYGEELETSEVNHQLSPSKRRKYNKKPKDSQIFSCWFAECNHRSGFRSAMKRHLLQAHQITVTNTTCLLCENSFNNYSDYLKHIKIHTRKSQCDVCMMTFLNDEKLAKHKNRVHDSMKDGERNFECEVSWKTELKNNKIEIQNII